MVSDLQRYESLKNIILNYLTTAANEMQVINWIKEKHKMCICFDRRSEDIKTSLSLLRILEKRNCLSAHFTKPLECIIVLLNNPTELLNSIQSYNATVCSSRKNIMCKDQHALPNYSEFTKSKKQKIHELLSEELGKSWRNLARSLSIKEADIDMLNERHPTDVKLKILDMLKLFENQTDPMRWLKVLCDGLKESRRTDLKTKIINIHNS
ncbi:fas-associated death domain protein-like [Arctopsyche grandis]|uniref:fas-associated death domain protein-like n=1 Tax=Arctopsyche grandis TaxID=121162 RepID=UPI00406D87DC